MFHFIAQWDNDFRKSCSDRERACLLPNKYYQVLRNRLDVWRALKDLDVKIPYLQKFKLAFMNNIPFSVFSKAYKSFQALHAAEVKFEIEYDQSWTGNTYVYSFSPKITTLKDVSQLATIWAQAETPFDMENITTIPPFLAAIQKPGVSAEPLNTEHAKLPNSTVKFYAAGTLDKLCKPYFLVRAPHESQVGPNTYRTVIGSMPGYSRNEIVCCVSQESPLYNYLDPNHIIVFVNSNFSMKEGVLITNQVNLDSCYLMAAYSVYPPCLKDALTNGVFLDARDPGRARLAVARAEKAIPERYQEAYRIQKAAILKDFEANAQNVLMSKLARNEIETIELNEIKITRTSATYETASIEADDFRDVVFRKVDPNSNFDIFTLIQTYCDHIVETIAALPKTSTGFEQAREFNFVVNGMPLAISVSTTNTRRKINGFLINKDELAKVLHRASCHHDLQDYNNFVKQVSRVSLFLSDVLSKGMPIKLVLLGNDRYGKPADHRHPKLRFKREHGHLYLQVGEEQWSQVKKPIEFLHRIEVINRQASRQVISTEVNGKRVNRESTSAEPALLALIPNHVEGTSADILNTLIAEVNKERLAAEKRSQETLAAVAKSLKAVKGVREGVEGYRVQGKLRRYFIEEESLKVWNDETNKYVCIVNGKGDMGVGADALITRMLAVANDHRVTQQIHTLKQNG